MTTRMMMRPHKDSNLSLVALNISRDSIERGIGTLALEFSKIFFPTHSTHMPVLCYTRETPPKRIINTNSSHHEDQAPTRN